MVDNLHQLDVEQILEFDLRLVRNLGQQLVDKERIQHHKHLRNLQCFGYKTKLVENNISMGSLGRQSILEVFRKLDIV
jgi:hypothetical protein